MSDSTTQLVFKVLNTVLDAAAFRDEESNTGPPSFEISALPLGRCLSLVRIDSSKNQLYEDWGSDVISSWVEPQTLTGTF